VSSDPLLQRAIRTAARGADPETTLDELLDLAIEASGATAAATLLWDGDRGALAVAGSRGLDESGRADLESEGARAGHPIHGAAHERVPATDPEKGISAWPVAIGGDGVEEPLGALALTGAVAPPGSEPDSGDRIAAIADLIALTVDRARVTSAGAERADWQERVAHSDALTGLANARTLSRVVELEIARAARQSSELCVALFDVDDLTAINADVGRAVGDDVLREVAAVAAESIRFVDTMARWGGDEFMLVAPGATGTTVVRRIVEAVAARPPIAGRRYTVSAGLARFPADGTTGEELVGAATAALNAARAVGPGTLAEAAPDFDGPGAAAPAASSAPAT
jgi:two-component system cell cycle response regulator